ncbi:MAG: CBS domain-containing protein [candidate division Zixibacteria bacterium]|jgi:CBS domain-containing protein|nr:CBS domain-containing protein [candidate division Zixibacteria bacterium]
MLVKDLLRQKDRRLITTTAETPVETAMGLLLENRISCLPVLRDDRLIGIVSDKDIFRIVYETKERYRDHTVADLMTTDLIVGVPDDTVGYIAGLMTQNRIRHIPILEGESLIGLLSVGDIVKTQMEDIRIENRYLKDFIQGTYPG